MSSPVSWDVAERVATWYSGQRAPFGSSAPIVDPSAEARLRDDFARFTEEAEALVVATTGLSPRTGPPRGVVVDRADWARRNIESFRRLLDPALAKLPAGKLPGPLAGVTSTLSGTQIGLVLGWMGTRVLGQYDLLIVDDDGHGDLVYYVGPNIVGLERRHGFDPDQFRLWIALHEVTHRCQFTAVAWLRPYYLSLVDKVLSGLEPPDPQRLAQMVRRAAQAVRQGANPLEDSGIVGLVATPEQLEAIGRIQALMSLLEGHGDITMGRAGAERIPDAGRFGRVLHDRRSRASFPVRVLQQLLGIEAKLKQYALGERFIEGVEAEAGPEMLARVWQGEEMLPTMDEIRDPSRWIARVGNLGVPVG
ncbi:MAG: zinc-dependent metalloprotease [Acidimicrobiales bacterium]